MSAIASYEERRFDGQRLFELFEDRLVIKGKNSLGADFENVVLLDSLQPVISTVRTRPKGFGAGLLMAIASMMILQGAGVDPLSYWGCVVVVMCLSGLLLAVATFRKVTWATLKSKAGTDALAVARVGPDKPEFEAFIAALCEQIRVCPRVVEGRQGE